MASEASLSASVHFTSLNIITYAFLAGECLVEDAAWIAFDQDAILLGRDRRLSMSVEGYEKYGRH